MNKREFLMVLRDRLRDLPEEDIQRVLDYYSEILADRIDEGMTEQEAVAALGTLDEIETQIRQESGQGTAPTESEEKNTLEPPVSAMPDQEVPQPQKPKGSRSPWVWVLLILGAPVWGSLLVAVLSVVFSIFVSLWSGIIGLYAGVVGLFAGVLLSFLIPAACGFPQEAVLLAIGGALVCLGLGILLLLATNAAARGLWKLSKWTIAGLVNLFKRKENSQ